MAAVRTALRTNVHRRGDCHARQPDGRHARPTPQHRPPPARDDDAAGDLVNYFIGDQDRQ
eukprot:6432483-Pyramimonas_sp.AAC.1